MATNNARSVSIGSGHSPSPQRFDSARPLLRPETGYSHTLRYLRAARMAITFRQRSFPTCYGPEFIAQKVRDWIDAVGAKTAHIEPGSPWENGYCESFNA